MKPMTTQNDIYTALRSFIRTFAPDYEVVQGQLNYVPPPKKNFVIMQELGRKRLATNLRRYYAEGEGAYYKELQENRASVEVSIQIDIYGQTSADVAQKFETLFRDYVAADFFPRDIAPLFCEDFRQIALLDTEKQYNQRWTSTIKFNILPAVTTEIEFINDVNLNLFPQS